MRDKRSWVAMLGAAVAIVTIAGFGSVVVRAQGPPIALLDRILADIRTLSADVDGILSILQPPAGPVTLTTPAVFVVAEDAVLCNLTNVGTEQITVQSRVLDDVGEPVSLSSPVNVGPGRSIGSGPFGAVGLRRCEFTFEGTAAAVRATLQIRAVGGGSVRVSVDAR